MRFQELMSEFSRVNESFFRDFYDLLQIILNEEGGGGGNQITVGEGDGFLAIVIDNNRGTFNILLLRFDFVNYFYTVNQSAKQIPY